MNIISKSRGLFLLFVSFAILVSSCKKEYRKADQIAKTKDYSIKFTQELDSTNSHTRSGQNILCKEVNKWENLGKLRGRKSTFLHLLISENKADELNLNKEANKKTRGLIITDQNFAGQYQGFKIYGYKQINSLNESSLPTPFINDNANYRAADKSYYTVNKKYYWPGDNYKCQFIAIAPSTLTSKLDDNSKNVLIDVSTESTMNQNSANSDILVANSGAISGANQSTAYPLNFKHILSAIKFATGDKLSDCVIKSISFKNVIISGTYNTITGTWSNTKKGNVSMTYNFTKNSNTGNGSLINQNDHRLMLIPQNLNGVAISIVFSDDAGEYTLNGNLSGQWLANKEYSYKISNSSVAWTYVFEVSSNISRNASQYGDDFPYTVKSYKQSRRNGSITRIAVPYEPLVIQNDRKTTYSSIAVNNIHNPGGASITITKGEIGKDTVITGNLHVAYYSPESYSAITLRDTDQHNKIFKDLNDYNKTTPNKPKYSDIYNLANPQGLPKIVETANCYIVNTYGKYRIPLVYGNSINRGTINETSFIGLQDLNSAQSGGRHIQGSYLQNFVDYVGYQLDNPFLANNSTSLAAYQKKVVWEDEPNLIQNITWNEDDFEWKGDGKFNANNGHIGSISFEINRENCNGGNAVIAILDSKGKAIWSWHIWVFDDPNIKKSGTERMQLHGTGDRSAFIYKFLRYPIGFKRGDFYNPNTAEYETSNLSAEFPDKKYVFTFTQNISNTQKSFNVTQEHRQYAQGMSAPYYQWGRKDPILPTVGTYPNSSWNQYFWCYWIWSGPNTNDNHWVTPITSDWNTTELQKFSSNKATQLIGLTISYPMYYNTLYGKGTYNNLWNMYDLGDWDTYKAQTTTKTIYDPSPPGFAVAPWLAFQALQGKSPSSRPSQNQFIDFYLGNGDYMSFPALGCRQQDNFGFSGLQDPRYNQPEGKYWTAASWNTSSTTAINISNTFNSSSGDRSVWWGKTTACNIIPYQYEGHVGQ